MFVIPAWQNNVGREDFAQERSGVQCAGVPGLTDECEPCICPPYGTAKKKRPCYLVGNLVATNWPIEKALHAIGYYQIPTK